MTQIPGEDRARRLLHQSEPFLRYLVEWEAGLQNYPLAAVVGDAGGPANVAVYGEDVVVGFCYSGRLSSPRIAGVVPAIARLFQRAHDLGVRHFVLPQDAHPPDSPEFGAYGPHCIVGTEEADTVPELMALPFSGEFVVMPKRSLNPFLGSALGLWLDHHPEVTHHIVTGDCTDLCVYQIAMNLKLRADELGKEHTVLVPEECVQTYDLPVDAAQEIGATPHDGDFLHLLFLYHMALNGIRVVRGLP